MSIEQFRSDFIAEIGHAADAAEDFLESAYAEVLTAHLEEAGHISGFDYAAYRSRGMRVDGYFHDEDEGRLDLFLINFNGTGSLRSYTQSELDTDLKRLDRFFEKSLGEELHRALEETSPGYGLSYFVQTLAGQIVKLRWIILTDGHLSERIQGIESRQCCDIACQVEVWDIGRLDRLMSSRKAREELVVSLEDFTSGGLPCLPAHLEGAEYNAYLAVVPGKVLAGIYDRYGARLLEQNVRCFLQARGKVNKGIRNTINNEPSKFFAYNNGITATAESVETEVINGKECILSIRNFQIVNGGQTTASIFMTGHKDKADLNEVFVQMKLSVVPSETIDEVVPLISRFANTQNKVNEADFFANHPFHQRIEEKSRRLWAPKKSDAARETKWFYERSNGQYRDAQATLTVADRKRFQGEYPPKQKITKTDLAKFENVWQKKPHIVSLGAQKNFLDFAGFIDKKWQMNEAQFSDLYFQHAVARAIVFKTVDAMVPKQSWYEGGYKANIVAYTISKLASLIDETGKQVNFSEIWKQQDVTPVMQDAILMVMESIYPILTHPPEGMRNISEWCKKQACWSRVQSLTSSLPDAFVQELTTKGDLKEEQKDAVTTQRVDNSIDVQTRVLNIGAKGWDRVREFGVDKALLSHKDAGLLSVACSIPAKLPTERQCQSLIRLMQRLEEEGFRL